MATAVRFAGRITDWRDDKGFGFVEPNGGGERAFVHVNEFQRASRRPVSGDMVSYLASKDVRGRLQARQIRFAGQKLEPRRQPSRLPRAAAGIVALSGLLGLVLAGILPPLLALLYATASALSYFLYLFDKAAAEKGAQRTPESSLHLADLLGGWPGALIAQQQFRHKTIKQPFQAIFWVMVALNIVSVAWLVTSGIAGELSNAFLGGYG